MAEVNVIVRCSRQYFVTETLTLWSRFCHISASILQSNKLTSVAICAVSLMELFIALSPHYLIEIKKGLPFLGAHLLLQEAVVFLQLCSSTGVHYKLHSPVLD